MLFLTKILEKLPATTSGILLGQKRRGICSLEDPHPKLNRETRISLGFAMFPKLGS